MIMHCTFVQYVISLESIVWVINCVTLVHIVANVNGGNSISTVVIELAMVHIPSMPVLVSSSYTGVVFSMDIAPGGSESTNLSPPPLGPSYQIMIRPHRPLQ